MSISKESSDEFKRIFKDEYGKEMTDEEAMEAGNQLVGFFELLWEMSLKDQKRKNRLKEEPGGFPVDGNYTCIVCHQPINENTGWYDENKQKCLSCQQAIDGGIVPTFVCHHRKSFFLMWELTSKFEIKTPTARKYVRQGELIARITPAGEHIFLKKENPWMYERYTAVRKSIDRHRQKESEAWTRKIKEEIMSDARKSRK